MSFHLHKFPLMSKSRKLHGLLTEQEQRARGEEDESGEEVEDEELRRINLHDFPGGSENFEAAVSFVTASGSNSTLHRGSIRCAAEYLDMAEDFAEDNLISRTERFLSQSVLCSLPNSVKALKSCDGLLPLADDLGIPERCIDAIVTGAVSADASSLLAGVNEGHSNSLLNGIDSGLRRRNGGSRSTSWVEDLSMLSLPLYRRLIAALKARDPTSELIEGSLVSYARRSIPGLSRSNRKIAPVAPPPEAQQMELLLRPSSPISRRRRAPASSPPDSSLVY
ncbi:hypothetical protein HPP92_018241 [Vanilla planifolia]|uniref:NPH3 domain-containing protein n=1 Tax=Vanilla planifolia TaxID=51239 RepID=A0A835QCL1_VANPL|nr:hypothetical protein HPP92_018241 [Vanilla planifolia]